MLKDSWNTLCQKHRDTGWKISYWAPLWVFHYVVFNIFPSMHYESYCKLKLQTKCHLMTTCIYSKSKCGLRYVQRVDVTSSIHRKTTQVLMFIDYFEALHNSMKMNKNKPVETIATFRSLPLHPEKKQWSHNSLGSHPQNFCLIFFKNISVMWLKLDIFKINPRTFLHPLHDMNINRQWNHDQHRN